MTILSLCPAVALFLLRVLHLQAGFAMLALAGVFVILSVIAGKKIEGMRPVVRWLSDDLFEVRGFSKAYREVLEQHAADAAGKVSDPVNASTLSGSL